MERYLIKFSKTNTAKYISHLDTMRTLHRSIRRAELPLAYSKGFNPHASISIAAPLSLGIASNAEYADIDLENYIREGDIFQRLNSTLPEGLKLTHIVYIREKMPSAMSIVEGARYSIKLEYKADINYINNVINSILSAEVIERIKKSKSGEKLENIRPLIKDIKIKSYEDFIITFDCLLSAGSKGSLSPNILADILIENSNGFIYGYANITREELYCIRNDKWIEILSFFKGSD